MTGPAMSITDLGISFGGLRAVDGVGFDAARNAITTVIGPNGAGKTTLFNLVSGALRPDRGRVELAGNDVTGYSPTALQRAGLARSFQITNLFFDLTVWENLRIASQVLEPPSRALLPVSASRRGLARVDALVEQFALESVATELAGALSHGEQRRLEIAMALASEPSILLLDEPTQGMSHTDTENAAELIRGLTSNVSILLIEHDIGLVMSLSDHVVVMNQGQKLAEGTPAQIRANAEVQAAYFGTA